MPLDLATLNETAEVAERMLLARFKKLESSDSEPPEALSKAITDLAHLTAIHKSLVHLDNFIAASTPKTPAAQTPFTRIYPTPETDRAYREGRLTNPAYMLIPAYCKPGLKHLFPDYCFAPDPNQKPDPHAHDAAPEPGDNDPSSFDVPRDPVRQHSIRQIAEIPAMRLDRIAPELDRITASLKQQNESASPSQNESSSPSQNKSASPSQNEPSSPSHNESHAQTPTAPAGPATAGSASTTSPASHSSSPATAPAGSTDSAKSKDSAGSTDSAKSKDSAESTPPRRRLLICPTIIPNPKPPPRNICTGFD